MEITNVCTIDTLAEACMSSINSKINSLKTLNIIVVGKTGVGKSTLINSVFRENLTDTGIGNPVTTNMRKIEKKGFPLAVYDTRGFELGKDAQREVKTEILDTIRKGVASRDINECIHCIWYCINTTSNRIEPEEIEWLKSFTQENEVTQVPVIIILTQSFSKKYAKKMQNFILNQNLDVKQVINVLAVDYEVDEGNTIAAYGLDTLITVMEEILPNELMETLQNVQRASLKAKKRYAQTFITMATAAAFGEGFSPIPFSDCTLLIPTQVAMIASITTIFGLDINKSILTAFVSSTIGAGGTTIAGRTIVSNLLKFVPTVGTLAGGVISGSTASVLTTALGEAYVLLMEAVYKGELKSSEITTSVGKKKMKELFKSQMKITKRKIETV